MVVDSVTFVSVLSWLDHGADGFGLWLLLPDPALTWEPLKVAYKECSHSKSSWEHFSDISK